MFIKYLQMISDKRVKIEQRYKTDTARYKHLVKCIEHLDAKERKRIERAFRRKK